MAIAILAVLFYHFFNRHIVNILYELQTTVNIFANQLSQISTVKISGNKTSSSKNRDGK
jgi:biopolymer transport protein ExbB/TolQ